MPPFGKKPKKDKKEKSPKSPAAPQQKSPPNLAPNDPAANAGAPPMSPAAAAKDSAKKEKEKKPKRRAQESPLGALESRRGSILVEKLLEDEERFFELVEGGNAGDVGKFLQERRSLNINCINYMGVGALHIAIDEEHIPVVELLLGQPGIEMRDASLHAVKTGNIELVKIVLDALGPDAEQASCGDSTDYSPDMTPMKLACQVGDYKMVRLFFERNHTVPKPHTPNCLCADCKTLLIESGPSVSLIRLNSYRAISSPAYICQVTPDPILYCFLLDSELKESAAMDKEFRLEYTALSEAIQEFTVRLMDQCRHTDEVETLLKLPWGYDGRVRAEFPRVRIAMEYDQKEFVAHSMVQQVLTAHWLGEFRSWPRYRFWLKSLHVVMRIVLLWFFCFGLLFAPANLRLLKKQRSPIGRFLLHLSSYIFFVFCVFMLNVLDTGRFVRGPPTTGFEFIIVLFVIGFIRQTLTQCWRQGFKRFVRIPWNWYDIVMELIFVLTFILWVVSLSDARRLETQERKFWKSGDAALLHEGLFALGTVLSFGKLAYFCLLSSRLGPLQVSMGKMGVQIAYFLILCFVINTSFAIPLTRMYAYYDGMVRTDSTGSTKTQLSSFSNFANSFLTLFWGMFGMSPVESADVIIENLTPDRKNPVINTHDFTEGVGRALFAVYELLMIIALVNTLIAILSNTFQKVVDNADIEFKFARTRLWIHFFDEASYLPSPFNLLPSLASLSFCTTYFRAMSNAVPGAKAKFSLTRCCYVEYEKDAEVDIASYHRLISHLVQRHFRAKELEENDE